MKKILFTALLAAAALWPDVAAAQRTEVVVAATSRSMIGVHTESVSINGQVTVTVRAVVQGSPAEEAGLRAGDVIVTVDGQPASQERLSADRAPGTPVKLGVRRGSTTREFTVTTAPRMSADFVVAPMLPALPDSVLGQMAVIISNVRTLADSMGGIVTRLQVDTLRAALAPDSIRVFRFGPDSVVVLRYGADTTRIRMPYLTPGEMPSTWRSPFPDSAAFIYRRAHPDSMRAHFERLYQFSDSMAVRSGTRFFLNDSTRAMSIRPSEIATNMIFAGNMAVAGAELSDLNPGLAEYFGVMSGVLVLNAHQGTPAQRAGLRPGDVIISVNGTSVTSVTEIRRATAGRPDTLQLRVLRRGEPIDITLGR